MGCVQLFESIDSDHSNNLDLVEYTKNVKKIVSPHSGVVGPHSCFTGAFMRGDGSGHVRASCAGSKAALA